MFKEWDQSGLTPALVDLAPKIFALDEYSQAQLFAYEQEMVSPLAIPAEAWSSFWHDYDKKADITRDYLAQRQGSFNFSDHFDLRADNAVNALDGIADLEVAGGYRIAGIGARPPSREVPAVGPSDHLMLPRYPIMFHYSHFGGAWRLRRSLLSSLEQSTRRPRFRR